MASEPFKVGDFVWFLDDHFHPSVRRVDELIFATGENFEPSDEIWFYRLSKHHCEYREVKAHTSQVWAFPDGREQILEALKNKARWIRDDADILAEPDEVRKDAYWMTDEIAQQVYPDIPLPVLLGEEEPIGPTGSDWDSPEPPDTKGVGQ